MARKVLLLMQGLLLLVSASCISGQKRNDPEFNNSEIYPSVACASDSSITYALFLPPQYDKTKPCPVFILFDPHGDGLLPVNLFHVEAAKNGFIVAGSNNSKNGIAIEQTTAIYHQILSDISGRFNIEKKAIYLGGFSGGSRVAGAAAITEGNIAGVVGCGAGLPNSNQKPVSPFSYLAVVGTQDFNYSEMLQLDESLDQAGYQHHLLVFDGIHQWPPKEVLPEIFTWLRFDAMRQKAIPANRNEINIFIEKNDKEAGVALTEANPVRLLEIYTKMLHFLQGLTDVAPIEAETSKLSGDKDIIAYRKQLTQLLAEEQELQRNYSTQIQQQDIEWWTKEATKLISLSEKPGKTDMNKVYKRLLGYLSLNCYMYSTGALKQNDLAAASKYIEIYRLIDPANAEHRYLAAKVAAINNNPDAVFDLLNKAVDLGFKDFSRLNSDVDFKTYLADERLKSLLNRK